MRTLLSLRVAASLWLMGTSAAAVLAASPVDMTSVGGQLATLRKEGLYADALALASSTLEQAAGDSLVLPWERRDLEVQVSTLERILSLPAAGRREVQEADTLEDQILRAYMASNLPGADSAARRQLAIRHRYLEGTSDEALSLDDLGFVLAGQDSVDAALDCQARALRIRNGTLGVEHPQTARSYNVVGNLLRELLRFDEAERHMSTGLAIRRKIHAPPKDLAQSCNDLGSLYFDLSRYADAEKMLREALANCAVVTAGGIRDAARAHRNLAFIMRQQGRLFEAAQQCSLSLTAWTQVGPEGQSDWAATLDLLGTVNYHLGHYDVAKELHSRALATLWWNRDRMWLETADCFNNLANVYDAEGRGEIADEHWRAAEAIVALRHGEGHPEIGKYLSNRANAARKRGRPREAADLCRRALRLWSKQKSYDHPDVVRAQWVLAASLILQDSLAAADSVLGGAASAFEVARTRMTPGPENSLSLFSPYDLMACSRLLQGRTDQAWPMIAKIQGRGLADLLFLARGRYLEPAAIARSDSLMRSIQAIETALREAAPSETMRRVPARRSLADSLRAELGRLAGARGALEDSLARVIAGTTAECNLAQVQRTLSSRSAMIGWLQVNLSTETSHTWGYVIRHEGPLHCVLLDPPSDSSEGLSASVKAQRLRERLIETARTGSPGGPEYYAVDLFDAWVRPLMPYLDGVEHLIAVLSRPMLGLPLEVLQDGIDDYVMADRFTVTYVPSPSIEVWLHDTHRPSHNMAMHALLVGDPPFSRQQAREMATQDARSAYPCEARNRDGVAAEDGRSSMSAELACEQSRALRRLPGTRWVVQQVRGLFREPVVLLGPDASHEQLQHLHDTGELRTFDVIHFGTHLWPNETWPERSALILSQVDSTRAGMDDPASVDGSRERLTAEEIVRGWDLSAYLVTISTCQSALGVEVYGEGYIGLASAFMRVGARSVLASLWDVTDCETALLLEQFYRELARIRGPDGGPPEEDRFEKSLALREARRALRAKAAHDPAIHGHPAYWAAFVLIGEP
jgi:CHAT domain-containing protein/tetratricopeptide (TPR) repeat protein